MTISYAQRRMWFLNRYDSSSPIYNVAVTLHFGTRVDVGLLRTAFSDVLLRHDILRTTYTDVDGEPATHVRSVTGRSLPWFDLGTVEASQVNDLCEAGARICFDVAQDLPVRAHVMRSGSGTVVVCLVVHHIACDGASLGIIAEELIEAYESRSRNVPPAWADLPLQYSDYAVWQRGELGDETDDTSLYSEQLSYWRHELAGLDGPISLPLDRDRPETPTSRGANVVVAAPPEVVATMRALARAAGSSEAIVLQVTLAATLSLVGGDRDVALGGPIAGRVDEALDSVVGFFANTWVLRLQVQPDDTFSDVLARGTDKALAAYDNQDLPFERVVEVLSPERGSNFPPLFQVATAWQSGVARDLWLEGEKVVMRPVHTDTAKFELLFSWLPQTDGTAVLDVEYATDIFDEATVRWIVSSLFALTLSVGENPTQPLVDVKLPERQPGVQAQDSHRHRAIHLWNETDTQYPEAEPLHVAFERQAAASPDAIAVRTSHGTVTYGELNRQANNIAWELRRQGVGPETFVGVCTDRSPTMVAAVLGVLKAGGAYLPVSASLPSERVAEMLSSTHAELVLVSASHHEWAPPPSVRLLDAAAIARAMSLDAERNPVTNITPDNTAYVIFTSGSTGRPKGVQVTHRPVHNLISWCQETHGFAASDIGFCVTSLDFDLSVFDIFGLLGAGASLYVADYMEQRDPELQLRVVLEERITFWNSVPGTLYRVLGLLDGETEPPTAQSLRLIYLSGDFTPLDLPDRLRQFARQALVVSLGGGTEAAIWSNYYDVDEVDPEWRSIPYGRPISNAKYYVLDEALEPCRIGVEGDLYIGGQVLATGYAGQPALTAARFISDPFGPSGARLYRTGDRASYFEDGVIAMHGRSDGQIKVRGFRVELGEIEHALTHQTGIARAVVSAPKDEFGERRLIAHVVPDLRVITDASDPAQHVSDWEAVYDQGYGTNSAEVLGEDFSLWNSSYTGEAIASEEMRSWRDAVVSRVLGLKANRVLEIGAGTGLLLAKIAPHVDRYWASDVSGLVIGRLATETAEMPWADRVVFSHQAADDFTDVPFDLDVIILNSVVQYFPHRGYLRGVLDRAWERLRPGGSLVIGDVRRRRSYRVFQTAVQLAKHPDASHAELGAAVMQAELLEKELLIDPEFFVEWAEGVDRDAVDVRLKDVSFDNELSRHRYEVVVRKAGGADPAIDAAHIPSMEWDGDAEVLTRILSRTDAVALRLLRAADISLRDEVAAARRVGTEESVNVQVPAVDRLAIHSAGWRAVLIPAPEGVELVDVIMVRAEHGDAMLSHGFRARNGTIRLTNDPSVARAVGEIPATARDGLAKVLPAYMIPSAIFPIPTVPLTANGKIDRAALLALTPTAGTMSQDANQIETQVARIYGAVLGRSSVGPEDNFFEIGGHSLLATRVASRVREEFGVEVPIRLVFERPTVRLLAAELSKLDAGREPIIAGPRPEAVPASSAQRRLWFLDKFEGPSSTYVIPFSLRLRGPLDRAAMRGALNDVVARHETLRTVFVEHEGEVFQHILEPESATVLWKETSVDDDRLSESLTRAARAPFFLATDIPIRADHLVLAPDDSVLLLSLHHIAADGWSLPNLATDLSVAYSARVQGAPARWEPLSVQYADYSLWQQRLLADGPDGERGRQLEYWRESLRDLPAELPMQWDHPRPPVSSFEGRTLPVNLGADLVARLRKLCLLTGTTMSMALQASLAAVLSRLGAGDDIPLGAPIAGRTDEALDPLIGFFVNTWVARVSLHDDPTLMDLLEQVRQLSLGAYANQDIPFEYLVDQLNPVRSTAHHPLFQVCLALQNNSRPEFPIPGIRVTHEPVEMGVARFDLFFNLLEEIDQDGRSSVGGEIEYATDLLEAATVQKLVDNWVALLDAWLTQPHAALSEIALANRSAETSGALDQESPAEASETLLRLFDEQVVRHPERIAISDPDGTNSVTFEELSRTSVTLAASLSSLRGDVDAPIVIEVRRSVAAVTAMLAATRLGLPFIVMEPSSARGWAERVMKILHARAIVDAEYIAEALSGGPVEMPTRAGGVPTVCFVEEVTPDGEVVLVGLGHSDLDRHCCGEGALFDLGEEPRRVICSSGLQSLAGVLEIFACLVGGHHMLVDEGSALSRVDDGVIRTGASALLGGTELYELFEPRGLDSVRAIELLVVTTAELSGTRARTALDRCPGHVSLRVVGNMSGFALVPLGTSDGARCATSLDERVGVLSENRQPLPAGFFGDLCIAETWADRPVRFIGAAKAALEPRAGEQEGRWRLTGRRARIATDGALELLDAKRAGHLGDRPYPSALVTAELEALATVKRASLYLGGPGEYPGEPGAAGSVIARLTEADHDSSALEHVERWKSLYESLYEGSPSDSDVGSDFRGWVRSSDRQAIPPDEMHAWRDAAVQSIRHLEPRRVLEIGAGTGLLAAELADDVEEYWATDLAATSIDRLQELVDSRPGWAGTFVLRCLPADQQESLPQEYFDTVILNSVVQYFPDTDYLSRVLRGALDRLAPGGSIFVGDVRVLGEDMTTGAGEAVRDSGRLDERELLVAPDFFGEWAHGLSSEVTVAVRLKKGRDRNELTAHRYDVVMCKDPLLVRDVSAARPLIWGVDVTSLDDLRGNVCDEEPVRLTGMRNTRIVSNDIHEGISRTSSAVDPEDLSQWGSDNSLDVACTWSSHDAAAFEAVVMPLMQPNEALDGLYLAASPSGRGLANDPGRAERARRICGGARRHLVRALPRRWLPERIELETSSGFQAAPPPDQVELSPLEIEVSRLFARVLELDSIAPESDFFDLGGSSLQVIRLVWLLREELGADIPVRVMFEHSTVRNLSRFISTSGPSLEVEDPTGPVLPIRTTGDRKPLWLVPPGGGLAWAYLGFASEIDRNRPVYALQARGFHGEKRPESMSAVVRDFAQQIIAIQAEGPYNLAGWSLGGPVAEGVAAELQVRGHEVTSLFIFDAGPSSEFEEFEVPDFTVVRRYLAHYMGQLSGAAEFEPVVAMSGEIFVEYSRYMTEYSSPPFTGNLTLFVATVKAEEKGFANDITHLQRAWEEFVQGTVDRVLVDCAHNEMMWTENAASIAQAVNRTLEAFD
jgi:amino acid adenylation domain-containing protein